MLATRRAGAGILAVEDTGPGIPPGERDRVFRRFYRAEAARLTPGHGLGLGLVAAIAKLHGATVAVTDAPGGGCRMEIAFPGG
ncbi:sensor histidine kinase [Methylobacterium persicinum]